MTKRLLAPLLVASALSAPAFAQSTPFDMGPESGLVVTPPPTSAPEATPSVTVPTPQPTGFDRYILPDSTLSLEGETSRRLVALYLTAAQAQAPATLHLSYLNAVMVAPEVSRLTVTINGVSLTSVPIAASAGPAALSVDVPSGVLKPGANVVEFSAVQRHRTDCTVGSTYQLWTRLEAEGIRLSFAGNGLDQISQLADIAAIGVDAEGVTTLRVVAPDMSNPDATSALMRLTQQLAIALRVADLRIDLVDSLSTEAQPGTLDLVLAPANGLPDAFVALRDQAAGGPVASLQSPQGGNPVLVVSGPDWAAIGRAAEAMMPAMAADGRPRIDLGRTLPLITGGGETSLALLGGQTTEFNGRRYTDQFQFNLPYDFYANRYGKMELVLDAAYSSDVLPGSEIDLYVNGQIASATPLLRTDGGLLRDTVIRIPMKSLQPGRNVIDFSVNLLTQSDQVCSAGWTGEAPTRFVFSATSALRMPDFARAETAPDLRALAATGMPYAAEPSVQFAWGEDSASRVAAMTILARLAAAGEQVTAVTTVPEAALSPGADALLIMPLSAISATTLARSGLALPAAGTGGDDRVLTQFSTGTPGGPLAPVVNWVLNRAGLTLDDLRVLPASQAPFAPAPGSLALSQMQQAEGGLWTTIAAADGASLASGVEKLVETARWRQIAGRVTTLNGDVLTTIAPGAVAVTPAEPVSPFNLRLVAANWFSGNILAFTGLIALAAVLLMFATSGVLTQIGRRK
ncbi:cellulose synthase regulator protein [Devosia equisanguinis]|uniref:Cyclic di-GMP-binding protein n=1 Tax=Devosia equisanguinis TaxID=2490941 RepID=A0A3S5D3H4_9HYPH|nr:cellulose biosynthesis cyclic di-GMP-binding regulatory protein BcsB [Devosia equisanguinis]VDS05272.1 cellulose synthase regulator protein [Devosia equisanguinis]